MSDYSKATNFAHKDTLPSGDADKIVKGTEIDDEFVAIQTAISTKANKIAPTFTGTTTMATAAVTTVDLGSWTITESGTSLIFSYSGTAKFKLASDGSITAVDDITAFGTI